MRAVARYRPAWATAAVKVGTPPSDGFALGALDHEFGSRSSSTNGHGHGAEALQLDPQRFVLDDATNEFHLVQQGLDLFHVQRIPPVGIQSRKYMKLICLRQMLHPRKKALGYPNPSVVISAAARSRSDYLVVRVTRRLQAILVALHQRTLRRASGWLEGTVLQIACPPAIHLYRL